MGSFSRALRSPFGRGCAAQRAMWALALSTPACQTPATSGDAVAAAAETAAAGDGAAVDATSRASADSDTADGLTVETYGGDGLAALPQCTTATDCPTAPPCQLALCTSKGTCSYTVLSDGAACTDGNACTAGDACAAGSCLGASPVVCNDDSPCTSDSCNPLAGCINLPLPASAACDDGDPCTANDACLGGKCLAGVGICQCTSNGDCAKYDDGDLCNGSLYCDKAAGPPFVCKLNPSTVVVCPKDKDGLCIANMCLPQSGSCAMVPAPLNTPCDDGDLCTSGDACDKGLCLGGTNTCFCKSNADCAAQEDGDKCNGTLYCNKAKAKCELNPLTVVTCQTANDTACSKNLCNPVSGTCQVVAVSTGKACDDGNTCTSGESCQKGACTATANTCQCGKDADCAKHEDGNACNGTLYCHAASGKCVVNPATVVFCDTDDDPTCLRDVCDPKTGVCSPSPLPKDGNSCSDGNPCTASDACAAGACKGGANTCQCQNDSECKVKEDGDLCNGTLYCDKAKGVCEVNPATVVACADAFDSACLANLCVPATGKCAMTPVWQGNQCGGQSVCSAGGWCDLGLCDEKGLDVCQCQADSDCAGFEDGDLCNGTLYCDKTAAKPTCKVNPKTVVVCAALGATCTQNQCQAQSGKCQVVTTGGSCDDGKACTMSDACQAGACAGLAKVCDDGIACTTDACQEPFGCVFLPGKATCDDGNACTFGDACAGGQCAGTKLPCDDGKPCTDDACDATKGCTHSANKAACSDGDACTQGDGCASGACVSGLAKPCNDGDLCTVDGCDKITAACVSLSIAATCIDANPCTADTCDPKVGCANLPAAGTCSDGNPCSSGDACQSGVCQPKGLTVCSDGNPCTDDSCDPKTGCVFAANGAPCEDGDVCSLTQVCKGGLCTATKAQDCNDGNLCTDDSCDPKIGCAAVHNTKGCDATPCTQGSVCKAGSCVAGPVVKLGASELELGEYFLVNSVAAYPNGDLAVAGGFSQSSSGAARIGADGNVVWSATTDQNYGPMHVAIPAADSSVAVLGNMLNQFGASVRRLGADGKLLSVVDTSGIGPWVAVAAHPAGGYWAVSTNYLGASLIARMDVQFKNVAMIQLCSGCAGHGVVSMADGRALVVGYRSQANSNLTAGWLAIHGNDGKLVSEQLVPSPTTHVRVEAVVARSGGGYLAVGYVGSINSGSVHALSLGLNGNGKIVWQKTPEFSSNRWLHSLVATPDGGAVLAGGRTGVAGVSNGWLVRIDAFGNTTWEQTYGSQKGEGFRTVTLRPDGGIAAAGHQSINQPWLVRADAWGNASCLNTGKCLTVDLDGCDDKEVCTLDTCSGAQGCQHAKMPEGSLCGDNKACDAGGKCGVPIGMKAIAAGEFWMGCVDGDPICASDEKPAHLVTLKGYAIDLTEVTVDAYSACVKAGACTAPAAYAANAMNNYGAPGRGSHPVNGVTWDQANDYCTWRGKRLPSEAEWEMAARGGCSGYANADICKSFQTLHPWGSAGISCKFAHVFEGGDGCATKATAPVGSKPAGNTPTGLSDMIGNVSEWVGDWYGSGYYAVSLPSDPTGPATGTARAARGSSLTTAGGGSRTSARFAPNFTAGVTVGFRCATHY